VLYGLPMFRFTTPVSAVQQPTPYTPTLVHITYHTHTPEEGLTCVQQALDHAVYEVEQELPPHVTQASLRFDFPKQNFERMDVESGSYYTYQGQNQATQGQPIQPRFSYGVSMNGAQTRGAIFVGGAYSDVIGAPLTATAVISNGLSQGYGKEINADQWYPGVLHLVRQLLQGSRGGRDERLVVLLGHMRGSVGEPTPAQQVRQRLYNRIGFQVFYYADLPSGIPDVNPPSIGPVVMWRQGNMAKVRVAVDDAQREGDVQAAGVWRVLVTYTPNTPGTGVWESVELTREAGDSIWYGTFPLEAGPVQAYRFLVQAVDAVGNVAADDNSGYYYSLPYQVYMPMVSYNARIDMD